MIEKTIEAILDAAFSVFEDAPTATLADVALEAGVGRATLHRHFSGRDELMSALAMQAMRELDEAFEAAATDAENYTDALRLGLSAMIPLANRARFLEAGPVADTPQLAAESKRQRAEMIAAIDQAKSEGGFAAEVPSPWVAESFDALLYAAWEMVKTGEATHKQAADLAWRTLTIGVGGAK
ncbi:Bacterial regulatory protein, tetR family [Shimia sp. SK013]|uniref:TetR/AcrR family transcriptional regulator n=1 Tax=Shimia sp. SK013 TaxID=1389006 RepID=UPI0006CD97DE|nr:TetR/AcrR family transcriptional regulator [Shimia sp. SK013]KPA20018.1 Bacterial regulatory protein, tetR family [Shimia sp. SK013]